LKIPFAGKDREGYSAIFPYKAEFWVYKMKKEIVPEFLGFVKGNTQGCEGSRPGQRMARYAAKFVSRSLWMINKLRKFKIWIRREKPGLYKPFDNVMDVPDMKKVAASPKIVEGWGSCQVIGVMSDYCNANGEEEL
jgi:hypothetical protein